MATKASTSKSRKESDENIGVNNNKMYCQDHLEPNKYRKSNICRRYFYKIRYEVTIRNIIVMILIVVIAMILIFKNHTDFYMKLNVNANDKKHEYQSSESEYITFGSFVGIDRYFIKRGSSSNDDNVNNLISIATFCDINLLSDAYEMALIYQQFGPISIAIYIDKDYKTHSLNQTDKVLSSILKQRFSELNNKYDIIIAILYSNESSLLYQKRRRFYDSNNMFLNIPMNALRNLAEYQVSTKWVFNIDIDFIYYSQIWHKFQDIDINNYIESISNDNHSIFIVPSFEIIENVEHTENEYESLNKEQLMEYIDRKK